MVMIGYQNVSCRLSPKTPGPTETTSDFCIKLSDNFIETGKSASNVFLALLVPAAGISMASKSRRSTSRVEPDNENSDADHGKEG